MRFTGARGRERGGVWGNAKFLDLMELSHNVDWGDCVIWYVLSLDDYAIFVDSFIGQCRERNNKAIYIKIGSDLDENLLYRDCLEICKFRYDSDCSDLVRSVVAFIQCRGPHVSYVFDDIGSLESRRGNNLVFDFFQGINPKLRELKAVSYWPLVRSSIFECTLAKLSGMAQLLLSVEITDRGVYIHPLKVPSKRYYQMLRPWFFDPGELGIKKREGSRIVSELLMRKVAEAERLRYELWSSRKRYEYLVEATTLFKNIVGESRSIREICKLIGIAARSDTTVLVQGESGTGKELVAEAIHFHSMRSGGPFIKVNCAAVSDTLLESELFGHKKGAFTGAIRDQKGKFHLADRGTILLDEIGCMSLAGQAKLLRVLQEKEIEPVGGSMPTKIDVRIIATTNLDLHQAMKKGSFREDLYHRLNVFPIYLPALRERKEDIPHLARYFLRKYSQELKKPIGEISAGALSTMHDYDWPGNVRELENAVEYAILMENGETLQPNSFSRRLPSLQSEDSRFGSLNLRRKLGAAEKETILQALSLANGIKKDAALILGIDPRNLTYYLKKHVIP